MVKVFRGGACMVAQWIDIYPDDKKWGTPKVSPHMHALCNQWCSAESLNSDGFPPLPRATMGLTVVAIGARLGEGFPSQLSPGGKGQIRVAQFRHGLPPRHCGGPSLLLRNLTRVTGADGPPCWAQRPEGRYRFPIFHLNGGSGRLRIPIPEDQQGSEQQQGKCPRRRGHGVGSITGADCTGFTMPDDARGGLRSVTYLITKPWSAAGRAAPAEGTPSRRTAPSSRSGKPRRPNRKLFRSGGRG